MVKLLYELHYVNPEVTKENFGIVKHVLGLHYRSLKVMKLMVVLHHKSLRMVEQKVGLCYRYSNSEQEVS